MTAYIDALVTDFSEYLPKDKVKTPFLEDTFISNDKSEITQETANVYLKKGYKRLVGSLLWAARNVYADCTLGRV